MLSLQHFFLSKSRSVSFFFIVCEPWEKLMIEIRYEVGMNGHVHFMDWCALAFWYDNDWGKACYAFNVQWAHFTYMQIHSFIPMFFFRLNFGFECHFLYLNINVFTGVNLADACLCSFSSLCHSFNRSFRVVVVVLYVVAYRFVFRSTCCQYMCWNVCLRYHNWHISIFHINKFFFYYVYCCYYLCESIWMWKLNWILLNEFFPWLVCLIFNSTE